MKKDVGIHDDDIVVQGGPRNPERRNAPAMKLLVDQKVHAQATGIGFRGRPNHLLLVPHHDIGALDAEARQCRQIPMEERVPTDLNEALGAMLGNRPEALAYAGCQDDGFHVAAQMRSKASRNPWI